LRAMQLISDSQNRSTVDNYQKLTLLEQLASHLKNISLLERLEQEISTA
jgi:hypothetical protein